MTSQFSRRTTRLHKTLSSDNMFFQHSGAVSAFGRRPRPSSTPPQTLQAKRRLIGRAEEAIAGIANESSAQVRMFNSTNASSNKPTLVVTYKPDYYGNAKVYVQKTGDGVNCLGYAMGINASVQPSHVGANLGTMGAEAYFDNYLKQYLRDSGYGIARQINRTTAIGTHERRIAMRIGTFNASGTAWRDYHFWRELGGSDAGLWADKPGVQSNTSRKLTSTDNPNDTEVIGWDYHTTDYYGDPTVLYYSGPTLYIAISAPSGTY